MATDYKRSKFMSDALLENATSLGVAPSTLVSNVARSGQLGTGIRMAKLDGATPAVFNPVVPVVLSVPSMWDPYPKLQEMLKALMETHAKSITGIDVIYTLEMQDAYTFHGGPTLATPTRTTRGPVNRTYSVPGCLTFSILILMLLTYLPSYLIILIFLVGMFPHTR